MHFHLLIIFVILHQFGTMVNSENIEILCKGRYDAAKFAKLDRVCDDCDYLFRDKDSLRVIYKKCRLVYLHKCTYLSASF